MMEALFSDDQIFDFYIHRVTREAEERGEKRGEERGIRSLVEVCQELGGSLTEAAARLVSNSVAPPALKKRLQDNVR